MTRHLFLLLTASLIIGCNDNEPPVDTASEQEYTPIVILNFRNQAPSPDLPWSITERGNHISGAMLMMEESETTQSEEELLILEATENDMLLCVISDMYLYYDLDQDHIQIWIDSTGKTVSIPQGLIEEFEDSLWTNPLEKQEILLRLISVYKPDITFINLEYSSITTVLQIADFWTDSEILSQYTVILYTLPATPDYRGWAVIAGEQINGITPSGLTAGGMFSTIRLLAGLQWENNIPRNIPALSILETLPGDRHYTGR